MENTSPGTWTKGTVSFDFADTDELTEALAKNPRPATMTVRELMEALSKFPMTYPIELNGGRQRGEAELRAGDGVTMFPIMMVGDWRDPYPKG